MGLTRSRTRVAGVVIAAATFVAAALVAGPVLAERLRIHLQVGALATTGKEQLSDRDFGGAAKTFERLAREAPAGPAQAEAQFLLGKARLAAGDGAGALDAWRRFIETYPDSAYASKARFLMADAHAALRKPKDAAETYRERVTAFTGEAYRGKLAKLYLDLGNEAYDGVKLGKEGDPLDPPRVVKDLNRAYEMFRKAREIHLSAEEWPVITHKIATCAVERGHADEAIAEWKTLLERAPGAAVVAEATFGLGKAYLTRGAAAEARDVLARMEERFADHALTPLAVELLGESFRPVETGDAEARKKGLAHWERFKKRYPQHEAAPRVFFRSAQALFNAGEYEASAKAFGEVQEKFAKHDLAPEAQLAVARCYLARKEYDRARDAYAAYLGRYPNHGRFVEAQQAMVEAALAKAEDLFAEKKYAEAEPVYREFLRLYPVSPLAPGAQMKLGHQYRIRAEAAGKKDKDILAKAIEEYSICASKYPGSAEAPASQLIVAEIYENDQGDLAEAIRQYERLIERFPYSGEAGGVRERIRVMKETSLAVETRRAFSTGEPFLLHVDIRNVSALRFKAYRLDLLEYVRKKHRVASVHDLAIEIVAPDKTWTHTVENYEPYRQFSVDVPLPLEGRGAWVIACEEDEYRAVTMVLRSDLHIVTKQAPGQLLVFAKDEKTGEAAAGVKVIASDGGTIVTEGETGKDGVWLWASDKVPSRALRLLAYRPEPGAGAGSAATPAVKDYAFGEVSPGSLVTWGYKTKAYIFTDRPVYRPGQTVKWKAIIRRVEGGEYRPTAGETLAYSIRDARGTTLIAEDEAKTNDYGSVSGEVTVGEEPPLGTYAIEVRFAGTYYRGTFEVEEYKKPEFLVEVTPTRLDGLTGEDVKAKARVRYYFGGAVANAPVRWAVYRRPYAFDAERYKKYSWFFEGAAKSRGRPDHDSELVVRGEGTADAKGEIDIAFRTESGASDQVYTLQVEALDVNRRWVAGAANVYITQRGFFAIVQLDKKVYRPKDTVTATVITVDAAHRPVEAKGDLVLFRRRTFEGRTGEEAERHIPSATGKDGKATITLTVDKGGEYRLAFVGKDRRGEEVQGGVPLFIAGDAEDLSKEARLIADREVYNRGDTADLLINSPAAPSIALLTFEGERVLDYRVLKLSGRSTSLAVEMRDLYSPNVVIKVAIPANHQLYEAQDEVLVLKFLKVAVSPDRPEARPGEEVSFRVETMDQGGKPVPAEVSLAVVDSAIYAIRADETPDIKPFFYDQKRELAVGTRSSYEFRYSGVTAKIPVELLAETERRKEEKEYEKVREGRDARAKEEYAREPARPGGPMPPPAPSAAPATATGGAALGRKRAAADESAAGEYADDAKKSLGANGKDGDKGGFAAAQVRKTFADTAHWDAHVITGKDGKATIKVKLPDNLTTWRATVRGGTKDTLVGSAEGEVLATKKMLVRLEQPRFATHKDKFVLSALVHNYTGADAATALELKAEGVALKPAGARLDLKAGEVARRDFEAAPTRPGLASLKATALAKAESDAVESTLPVLPFGLKARAATSGALGDEASWRFEIPADRIAGTERLEILIAPSISTAVMDALYDLDVYPYGCIEQTVNRFLPALAMRAALTKSGVPDAALAARVDEAVRRGITRLADLQNTSSGGWGWWPESAPGAEVTAYALFGLELAQRQGFYVDPGVLSRGRQGAQNIMRGVGDAHDARALVLAALAMGDARNVPGDELSRAIRAMEDLSPQGLAMLIVAASTSGVGREADAGRAIERLKAIAVRDGPHVRWRQGRGHGWFESDVEGTAWAVYALASVGRADDVLVEGAVRWLLAARGGSGWRSTKETGAVILGLAQFLVARGIARTDCTVSVLVDDREMASAILKGGTAGEQRRRLVLEGADLPAGKHTLTLRKKGTGSLHFAAVATAVRAADSIAAEGTLLTLGRKYVRYVPPTPATERDPKERPKARGYSIVEPQFRPTWEQETALAEVRSGDRFVVKLILEAREALAYVVVEDALPAGCEAVREGADGGFDRMEPRDQKVAFFLSRVEAGRKIVLSYVCRAITPGTFHALAAEAYPMYEPEIVGRSASAKLAVLEAGAAIAEGGAPTPDELYAQVIDLLDAKRHADAKPVIAKLLKDWKLLPAYHEELLYRLFQVELALKNPGDAVKAYETLVDRNPRRQALPLAESIGLTDSYFAIADYIRSRDLCRGIVAQAFQADLAVAEVYRSLGRELPAQEYLAGLVRRYPDADYVIDGWYRVARRYYDLERPPSSEGPKHYDPRRPRKMYDEAFAALKEFIVYHPASPWCDDAQQFAMLARFEVEDYEPAAIEAMKLVKRYPASEYLDDAYLTLTLARFKQSKYDEALSAGTKLLELRIKVDEKRTAPSPFVPQVQHLFAKIHHLRGDYAKAVEYYRLVSSQIEDARDALQFFEAKGLEVPEVVAFAPGEKPKLKVRLKNAPSLAVKVYKVDLLILFAKQKSLAEVHRVDLTGVSPIKVEERKLDLAPYVWHAREIDLPFAEKGVYLVTVKAGDMDQSSVAIVTEIDLKVHRQGDKVRVYAVRRDTGLPVPDVYCTISDGSRIVGRGRTDPRGLFEARGVYGKVFVVSEKEGSFALYRE